MKLKIENCTDYDTQDIRRITKKVMQKKGVQELKLIIQFFHPRRKPKTYGIRRKHRGTEDHTKLESLNTELITGHIEEDEPNTIWMRLPTERFIKKDGKIQKKEMHALKENFITEYAQTLEHEIDHLLGLDHKDMTDWWELPVEYAKSMTIRRKI